MMISATHAIGVQIDAAAAVVDDVVALKSLVLLHVDLRLLKWFELLIVDQAVLERQCTIVNQMRLDIREKCDQYIEEAVTGSTKRYI